MIWVIVVIPNKKEHIEPISFGLQKDSPYQGLFNYQIKKMQENGIFDQIFEKYEVKKQECPGPMLSLGFENCITAFFPIIVGIIISLILLLLEFHPNSWTRFSTLLNYYNQKDNSSDLFYTFCSECKQSISNVTKGPSLSNQVTFNEFENQLVLRANKELPEPID